MKRLRRFIQGDKNDFNAMLSAGSRIKLLEDRSEAFARWAPDHGGDEQVFNY